MTSGPQRGISGLKISCLITSAHKFRVYYEGKTMINNSHSNCSSSDIEIKHVHHGSHDKKVCRNTKNMESPENVYSSRRGTSPEYQTSYNYDARSNSSRRALGIFPRVVSGTGYPGTGYLVLGFCVLRGEAIDRSPSLGQEIMWSGTMGLRGPV